MKMRKTIATLAALMISTAGLAACGSGSGGGGGGAGAAGGKDLTVGVTYPTANSPFFKAYVDFIEDGAKQLDVKITQTGADDSEEKQLADVQNMISQGVDGLVIIPVSTSIAPTLLRTAARADVPVVVTDRYPGYKPGENDKADYVAFIGPNDEQAGEGIETSLAKAGGTKFLGLGGVSGNSVSEGRKKGLEAGIKASGGDLLQFEVAGDSEEDGQQVMENLLQANKKGTVNAVWCFNDNLCMGAIKAAKNAGRDKEIKFGGMDLTPQAVESLENGSYSVSYGGHWLQGGFGLAVLYDYLNDRKPAQPIVKLNLLEVTPQNVAEFKKQFVDNPPDYDFKELTGGGKIDYDIKLD